MKFTEYLLYEGAGNLKGFPNSFIKTLVGKGDYDFNGGAGENSEIELFKKNAKRIDVTKAAKMVAGYTPSSEQGYSSKSPTNLDAIKNKDKYAAVAIKVNGEWSFLAAYDSEGDGNNKFKIISSDGVVTKPAIRKQQIRNSRKHSYRTIINKYDRRYVKASEIPDIIDFSQDVEIYLVTKDLSRKNKQKQRKDLKTIPSVSPEKRRAIIKFLQKKSGGIINVLKEEIQKDTDNINKYISETIERATSGKPRSVDMDFQSLIQEIEKKIKEINTIGRYIEEIIKDGYIKLWSGDDSYTYRRFKEVIKDLEKEI